MTQIMWLDNLAPDIGHAELRSIPDTAALAFSFAPASSPYQRRGRWNAAHFVEAAEAIHDHLALGGTERVTPWLRIASEVRRLLASRGPEADRVAAWSKLAGGVPMGYDPLAWRSYSLSGGSLAWDGWRSAEAFLAARYVATGAPEWFWWHAAAREHRAYVLGQVPGSV
jgi:hypothetical protein